LGDDAEGALFLVPGIVNETKDADDQQRSGRDQQRSAEMRVGVTENEGVGMPGG